MRLKQKWFQEFDNVNYLFDNVFSSIFIVFDKIWDFNLNKLVYSEYKGLSDNDQTGWQGATGSRTLRTFSYE